MSMSTEPVSPAVVRPAKQTKSELTARSLVTVSPKSFRGSTMSPSGGLRGRHRRTAPGGAERVVDGVERGDLDPEDAFDVVREVAPDEVRPYLDIAHDAADRKIEALPGHVGEAVPELKPNAAVADAVIDGDAGALTSAVDHVVPAGVAPYVEAATGVVPEDGGHDGDDDGYVDNDLYP
jgi:hypothetical protein